MLFPRVKSYTEKDGFIKFNKEIFICFADDTAESLINAASLLIQYHIKPSNVSNADIILKSDKSISNNNSYFEIDCIDNKIIATFTNRESGRDALSVIGELISNGTFKKAKITDWPDLKLRSFMQDVGRKYVHVNEMKSQILLMAKMRMNVLHFHFTEHTGFGIALKDFPKLKGAPITGGKQYTEEEITEIVKFADDLCIDVIPEVDLPAHANAITNEFPELLCKTVDGNLPNGWALCVGNDETYIFLEKLLTSVTKLFKSEYFHLGTDEISMRDCDRIPKPVADWQNCSICSLMGLGETELFYYFVRRSYEILKKLGKKMIIWNDQIDISKSPDIPHDIIIEFWRVAGPHRGPIDGCSMQRFLEEGFDVINANYPDTYIDLYVEYERLKNWNPCKFPADDKNTKGKIIGADFCAWDVFNHFVHSVPVSTLFFAEKFRNIDANDYDNLLETASKRLLGIKDFNIFEYTNKVIDLDENIDIFKADANLLDIKNILTDYSPKDISEEYIKNVYLDLINKKL